MYLCDLCFSQVNDNHLYIPMRSQHAHLSSLFGRTQQTLSVALFANKGTISQTFSLMTMPLAPRIVDVRIDAAVE